jgi:hypothetical protein
MSKRARPLARCGIPIFSSVIGIFDDSARGKVYYWFATEDHGAYMRVRSRDPVALAAQTWHGPFATRAEAAEAAKLATVGDDCAVRDGGMWDPAWDRPQ